MPDADFTKVILDRVLNKRRDQNSENPIIVWVNSPITIIKGPPPETASWWDQALHSLEAKSIRLAVCVLGIVTLTGFVSYKLGISPHTAQAAIVETVEHHPSEGERVPGAEVPSATQKPNPRP